MHAYPDPMHAVTNVVTTVVELLSAPGTKSSVESIITQELLFGKANCRLPPRLVGSTDLTATRMITDTKLKVLYVKFLSFSWRDK